MRTKRAVEQTGSTSVRYRGPKHCHALPQMHHDPLHTALSVLRLFHSVGEECVKDELKREEDFCFFSGGKHSEVAHGIEGLPAGHFVLNILLVPTWLCFVFVLQDRFST